MSNGNTLITEGNFGRIFQVTPEGKVVWEYINPYFPEGPEGEVSNAVFRATHYSAEELPAIDYQRSVAFSLRRARAAPDLQPSAARIACRPAL